MSTQRVSQDKGRFENWKRILAIIRERLPSREDLILVLSACVFLIHLWAYMAMFQAVPAWLMRMGLVDLTGTISYVLVFALFESLLVWFILVCIAWILPATWMRERFILRGLSLLLVLSILFSVLQILLFHFRDGFYRLSIYIFIALQATTLIFTILAEKVNKLTNGIHILLERLMILSAFYVIVDLIALVVILLRNFLV